MNPMTQTNEDPLVTALAAAMNNGNTQQTSPQRDAQMDTMAAEALKVAGTVQAVQPHPQQGTGPAQPKAKPKPRLGEMNFTLAEQKMNVFAANAEIGTKPEDVVGADYWTNVAHKLTPGDLIHVRAEDLSWYVLVMVMVAEKGYAKMEALNIYRFAANDEEGPQGDLVIRWKGQSALHAIQRRSTGQWVKEGFRTRADAAMFLVQFLKENESKV